MILPALILPFRPSGSGLSFYLCLSVFISGWQFMLNGTKAGPGTMLPVT
jgi:hypothetical protein